MGFGNRKKLTPGRGEPTLQDFLHQGLADFEGLKTFGQF